MGLSVRVRKAGPDNGAVIEEARMRLGMTRGSHPIRRRPIVAIAPWATVVPSCSW